MTNATIQAQVVSFPPNGIDYEQLNVDITLVEVQQSFKKLKRHKDVGIDWHIPKSLVEPTRGSNYVELRKVGTWGALPLSSTKKG